VAGLQDKVFVADRISCERWLYERRSDRRFGHTMTLKGRRRGNVSPAAILQFRAILANRETKAAGIMDGGIVDCTQSYVLELARSLVDSMRPLPFEVEVKEVSCEPSNTDHTAWVSDYCQVLVSVAEEPIRVYFARNVPELDAVIEMASQLQDLMSETRAGWGMAIPKCETHSHPMRPKNVSGVGMWVCPVAGAGTSIPILRGAS
jgi:hypothetical protein